MSSATWELEVESDLRQLKSDLRSATNLKRQSEAVEYKSHRNEEVKEEVLSRSNSYQHGSAEKYHVIKITLLKEQIGKLEQKLEKASESLNLEKEKNRTLQADLLHMEQEMRDSRIDLRIARRESKTAVEKLVKLEESANFFDSNELKEKDEEVENLRSELKKVKMDLEKAENSLYRKEQEAEERKKDLGIASKAASTAQEHEREAQRLKAELVICQRLKTTAELELKDTKENLSRLSQEKARLLRSLEQEKAKLVEKDTTISTLKHIMGTMDNKIKHFEAFENDVEEKELELESENSRLKFKVERVTKELSTAKQQINQDKSLKLLAENRLKEMEELLKNQEENCIAEISSLKGAVIRAESEAEKFKIANRKIVKSSNMEKLLADAESAFDTRLATLEEKNAELQRDSISLIIERNSLENTNSQLGDKLSDAIRKAESYEERIIRLDFALDAANKIHMEREHKFEVTLLQQGKLIEFLQAMTEQPGKKNKTLTDKLLGSGGSGTSRRDSLQSDTGRQNPAYRVLEERMEMKDGQIRSLTQQLKYCKEELAAAKSGSSCPSSSI